MAVGYNSNDGSVATLINLGWDSPSGQMYSNLDDINKVSLYTPKHCLVVNIQLQILYVSPSLGTVCSVLLWHCGTAVRCQNGLIGSL